METEPKRTFKEDLLPYYGPRALAVFLILSILGSPPSISVPGTLGIMMAWALDREYRK